MKTETISLQRRYLMIAGTVTALAAMILKPSPARAAAAGFIPVKARDLPLVLSGRLMTAGGTPLSGAEVDTCRFGDRLDGNNVYSAISDADGRFVITLFAEQGSQDGLTPMHVKIRHRGRRAEYAALTFNPDDRLKEAVVAHTLLDSGTVRASFSLNLA